MKTKSIMALAMCLAVSAVSSMFAASIQPERMPFVGDHSTMSVGGITTSSYVGALGVVKVAQISFPSVYVWPAFSERWFSTVSICNTVGNIFAGAQALPMRIQVFDSNSILVSTIDNKILNPNACLTYTSDVPGDELFAGIPPGVYTVIATVIAADANALLGILNDGGNLHGSVNSTATNFIKPNN